MLTSYFVRCPHKGCAWFGSLLPSQDTQLWRGSLPGTQVAVFHCPSCDRQWRARVVGDDVRPLPLDEKVPTA
jgi:hypothetical protein